MRYNYKTLWYKILAIYVALFCSIQSVSSQSTPIGGKLNGENIVSISNLGGTELISTAENVYKSAISYLAGGFNFGSNYDNIFTAPKGRTIQSVGTKLQVDSVQGVTWKFTIIALDNGDIYKVPDSANNGLPIGHLGLAGSESWEKVIGDALFALTSSHIYVSRDNGNTWQQDVAGLSGAFASDLAQDTSLANLYTATSSGLYKKDTIPGSVWNKVTTLTGTTNVNRVFIDRKNRILVAGNGGGIWLSTDNGVTWPTDTLGIGNNGKLDLFADDAYGNLYGANSTTKKLYRSNNGTLPWQSIDAGITAIVGNATIITSLSGDTLLAAGSQVGIFLSNNQGSTWIKRDSGIIAENYFGLAKLNNGKLFAGTSLGVFLNNTTDSSWSKSYPQNGYSGQVSVFVDNTGTLYALDNNITHSFSPKPIVKSVDQGSTWTIDTTGLSAIDGDLFYLDYTGAQHNCNTHYGVSFKCNLWTRHPPGSWVIDTTGFPATSSSFASSMVSDKNGYLYVSGFFSGKKLMRRPIAGGSWVIDTLGIGTSVTYFKIMATGYHGDVIGTDGSVIEHRNLGTWSTIPLPSQLSLVNISAITEDSAGNIFAAFLNFGRLGKGVFYTKDFGITWTLVGLDSIAVTQLIAYNDTVYALTSSAGLFKLTAPQSLPVSNGIPPTIDSVAISYTPFSNTSGVPVSPYYTNYPPTATTTATVYRGDLFQLSLKINNGGNPYNLGVWVDYNNDSRFDTSENMLLTTRNTIVGSNWIQVPLSLNASSGKLRIRVTTDPITSNSCCSSLSNGETEDYTLTFNQAANCRWLGSVSTNWHDPANWSCGIIPDSTKSVLIPTGTNYACTITTADVTVDRLWIQPGATVTVSAPLKLIVKGSNSTANW